MSAPYVKLDTPLSEHAVVCRGCLADCGEMKDIREWGLIEDFKKYAGIQVFAQLFARWLDDLEQWIRLAQDRQQWRDREEIYSALRRSDGMSELICTSCEDSLDKCKLFAQQCKNSDISLRNLAVDKKASDINNVTFKFNKEELIFTIVAPDQETNINLLCPYNCKETYTKKTDLLNHLIRVHKHSKDYKIDYRYHCWQKDCVYHEKSFNNKYFTGRKSMNQHYNKVHRSKIFHCEKCECNFATTSDFNRHLSSCNMVFVCDDCNKEYSNHDRLIVHLMRRHPEKHKEYKAKKSEKRKAVTETITKKPKMALESLFDTDSPKRSFATQTKPKQSIKNDVTLPAWQNANNEISTQTGYEDVLSVKSSEDDSLFYSETTLSDIQTQTFPLEFGLFVNRSHKETLTESLDMSIKGTQTCFCFCDSPKLPFGSLESVTSSNLTSTETQTAEYKSSIMSDELLSLNSTETQTCFDEAFKESL